MTTTERKPFCPPDQEIDTFLETHPSCPYCNSKDFSTVQKGTFRQIIIKGDWQSSRSSKDNKTIQVYCYDCEELLWATVSEYLSYNC